MKHKIISMVIIALLAVSVCGALPAKAAPTAICAAQATGNWSTPGIWSCATVPNANDTVTIGTPYTVTLTAAAAADNLTISSGGRLNLGSNTLTMKRVATGVTVNTGGTLDLGTGTIVDGTGGANPLFTLNSGATLLTANGSGVASSGASGSIQTTGTRTYSPNANYTYNGTGAQTTGTGLPTNLTGVLTINSGNTVTLNNAEVIASGGTVNIVAGTFAAGTNLTMATTSSINRSGGTMTGTPQGSGTYNVTYTGNSMTTSTELAGAGLNNVTVNLTAGQTLTLDQNRALAGNLVVTSGTFDLSTFTVSVNGTVTNNGTLKQTKGVNNATVQFLHITDAAGTGDKYFGATITTASNLGSTIVAVSGNQVCPNARGFPVKRCFTIDKALPSGGTLTLYYTDAELQGQTEANIQIWQYSGSGTTWNLVTGTRTNDTTNNFVQVALTAATTANQPYALKINTPTAVNLASFTAAQAGDHNAIAWETVSELHNLGFNLWRGTSANAPDVKLNQYVIPSQAPGGTDGFAYTYPDSKIVSGTSYYYWLEDVDLDGTVTRHGPVTASAVGDASPSALRLIALQAGSPASPALALPLVALPLAALPLAALSLAVLGAGGLVLSRRRR